MKMLLRLVSVAVMSLCIAGSSVFVSTVQANASSQKGSKGSTKSTGTTSKAKQPKQYTNVDKKKKNGPSNVAKGKTVACADGTESESEHAKGTCADHGGVKRSK